MIENVFWLQLRQFVGVEMGVIALADVCSIREAVQRAKGAGMPISEYSLRLWTKTGEIPTMRVGRKVLIYFPLLVRYLQCQDGDDNEPATVGAAQGIRRVDL